MRHITNTFVLVAPDCPVETSEIPKAKPDARPSIPRLQYELLTESPYRYTLDDLIYEVHIRHKEIPSEELERRGGGVRDELLSKSHPCMRASMLAKKYGWGVHYNEEGKLALYPVESEEYAQFAQGKAGEIELEVVRGMRSKRE
ncbi:hypothetical protein J31TS4_04000 [Paenibacillus sp. J31TS4]|uniref:DUF6157 family protein n=1 Tax=Paenibacillus sp. J31TS4 TaxID=2807195 RepID=UPI001B0C29C5|nr:DUF6157 family protein [Paenibacillus sp. J31TS4]GIP37120.1 hypothetical protein J31TS4_04000 [Paenibacillus sp. J31TS4]